MTRPVECLLVGTGSVASEHAIAHLSELVRSRFDIAPTILQGERATSQNVLSAFDELALRNRDTGTLFIVMFSGHGGIHEERHYWFLRDLPIDDETIIDKLAAFHRDSEVFIVSDCCYGGQMIHKRDPDAADDDHIFAPPTEQQVRDQLHLFTRRAAFQLQEYGAGSLVDKGRKPKGHVVLAAASDWLLVRGKMENDFTRALCEAIPRAPTYAALQPAMIDCCTPSGQCNWLVDAMPAVALMLPPLVP